MTDTLFELLRDKRTQLAIAANVPPYIIFSDRSLAEMATYFPQTRSAFAAIYGVGENKLVKYADEFIPIIQEYCREHDIQEKRRSIFAQPQLTSESGSKTEEVANAYNAGHSVIDLMQDLGVKERTILNHLWKYHLSGEFLRPGGFLELSKLQESDQQRVLDTFESLGPELLRPVFDALDEEISFDELHILRLHFVSQKDSGGVDIVKHVVRLGKSNDNANVPELLTALNSPDGNVRRLAASALGKLRDPRAVQPLLDLLANEDKPQVRQYAVKALGKVGDDRARETLQQISGDEREKYYTQDAAKTALKQL